MRRRIRIEALEVLQHVCTTKFHHAWADLRRGIGTSVNSVLVLHVDYENMRCCSPIKRMK